MTMTNYKMAILSNSDISESFRMLCLHCWYSHAIRLKDTALFTHKLIVDVNNVRMHTIVQMNNNVSQLIFLN